MFLPAGSLSVACFKTNFEPEPNASQLSVHYQSALYQFVVMHCILVVLGFLPFLPSFQQWNTNCGCLFWCMFCLRCTFKMINYTFCSAILFESMCFSECFLGCIYIFKTTRWSVSTMNNKINEDVWWISKECVKSCDSFKVSYSNVHQNWHCTTCCTSRDGPSCVEWWWSCCDSWQRVR